MTTGHVFIATSLDGYIAREDGGLDWLESAEEDHCYGAFMADIDGIVMGRRTFETALGFDPWPYDRPLVVLGTTLHREAIPARVGERVVVARSVAEALDHAQAAGWRRAYVDGGATIRAFLAAGAIADMVLTRVPVLLGRGLPLFGPEMADVPLIHVATRAFASGLVQSHYRVAR